MNSTTLLHKGLFALLGEPGLGISGRGLGGPCSRVLPRAPEQLGCAPRELQRRYCARAASGSRATRTSRADACSRASWGTGTLGCFQGSPCVTQTDPDCENCRCFQLSWLACPYKAVTGVNNFTISITQIDKSVIGVLPC